jgi:hypothetical protein
VRGFSFKSRSDLTILGVVLVVLTVVGLASLASHKASGDSPTPIDACREDLAREGELREAILISKNKEIARLKVEMMKREAFWQKQYEEQQAEKAGSWCWENLKEQEKLVERNDKDCTFNMRMAKLVTNEGNMKQLKNRLAAWGLSPAEWCNASPSQVKEIADLTGLDGSTGVPIISFTMSVPVPLTEAEQIKEEE